MQGAALKLTALAASLAVGFVVLVQTQQQLREPQSAVETGQNDSGTEPAELTEPALGASEQLTESEQANSSPYFPPGSQQRLQEHDAASEAPAYGNSGNAEPMAANQLPPNRFDQPPQSRPIETETQTAQLDRPELVKQAPPANPIDLFADQLNSRINAQSAQLQSRVDQGVNAAQNGFAEMVETAEQSIKQVNNEGRTKLQLANNEFAEQLDNQAGPVIQAFAESVDNQGVATVGFDAPPAVNVPAEKFPTATDAKPVANPFATQAPATKPNAPAGFPVAEPESSKPPMSEPAVAPAGGFGFPAAFPESTSEPAKLPAAGESSVNTEAAAAGTASTENGEQPAQPQTPSPFGFPVPETNEKPVEVNAQPAEAVSPAGTKANETSQTPAFPGFPPTDSEPVESNSVPAAETPGVEMKLIEANPMPAPGPGFGFGAVSNEPAAAAEQPSAKPPEVVNQPQPAPAFFDGFGEASTTSDDSADQPYRTLPEMNADAEPKFAGPDTAISGNTESNDPAASTDKPFTLSPQPTAGQPTVPADVAEVESTTPAPKPATMNPFAFGPAAADKQPSSETPTPQPAGPEMTAPPAFADSVDDPAAAPFAVDDNQDKPSGSAVAPPASTDAASPTGTAANTQPEPEPEPAQPSNPFGAIGSPAPAAFPGMEAAPLELTDDSAADVSKPEAAPVENSPADTPTSNPATVASPANMEPKPELTPEPKSAASESAKEQDLIGSAQIASIDNLNVENVQQPKIELFKSAPENAVLGQPLVYSIEVVNTGTVTVQEVRVEDQFPAGTKLTGTIPRAELIEKRLVWKFDQLEPEERKKILVRVVPVEAGSIGSISTVSYKSSVAAKTMVTAPKIELNVTADAEEVAVGESVSLKFMVQNTGQGTADGVLLRNLIPLGLEHPAGADLEYEIGALQTGEIKEVTLTLVAKQAGLFHNVASIKSTSGLKDEQKTAVNVIPSAMSISQTGPTRRFVGHTAEYAVKLTNNTSRSLEGVNVAAQIPGGFEFVSASAGGAFNPAQRRVVWTLPTVDSNQPKQLTMKLKPLQPGTYDVNVQARNSAGHEAAVETTVKVEGFASLAVRIPEVRGPAAVGERVSLRFKIVNRGSAEATQVLVTCKIPDQLNFLSANGPVKSQQVGDSVQFNPIAKLSPNEEKSFDVVFTAGAAGDSRVLFEVNADQVTTPLKHEEQVVVYGE